jgi:hypothetical protein
MLERCDEGLRLNSWLLSMYRLRCMMYSQLYEDYNEHFQ